ncbi:unnamed protein product [Strongylus vulgaris]|uniref:Uncharacterized protein n=1 Tax=Strongylus vulgaris TaxID=40348 RepID=A0A3P7IX06_STRVU|nr:unnamed protein product [Strongylus vulgaris]
MLAAYEGAVFATRNMGRRKEVLKKKSATVSGACRPRCAASRANFTFIKVSAAEPRIAATLGPVDLLRFSLSS